MTGRLGLKGALLLSVDLAATVSAGNFVKFNF